MGFVRSWKRPTVWRTGFFVLLTITESFGSCASSRASDSVSDPRELFEQARAAYDAAQWYEASARYEKLLAAGYEDAAVWFNLGNAYFRGGDLPRAIAAYRVAQYRRPRDQDIAANLRFAIERSGALPPAVPAYQRIARYLSASEWVVMGYIAWSGVCLPLALAWLWARGRRYLFRVAALAGLATLVAVSGWAEWYTLHRTPEAVVRAADVQARFAPLDDAVVHFTIPAGTIVRVIGTDGTWRRIRAGGKDGWVRESELLTIPFRIEGRMFPAAAATFELLSQRASAYSSLTFFT